MRPHRHFGSAHRQQRGDRTEAVLPSMASRRNISLGAAGRDSYENNHVFCCMLGVTRKRFRATDIAY
jgi:hypothetical protein